MVIRFNYELCFHLNTHKVKQLKLTKILTPTGKMMNKITYLTFCPDCNRNVNKTYLK